MTPARLILALTLLALCLGGALVLLADESAPMRQDDRGARGAGPAGAADRDGPETPEPPADGESLPSPVGELESLVAVPPSGRFGSEVPDEGRTSVLAGKITIEGLPTVATLTALTGPNAGDSLTTEADGSYTWAALYPGLSTVRVDAGFPIVREVLLRHRKTVRHDLDLGQHGEVEGLVLDDQGDPVIGASVSLDGAETRSADKGYFSLPRHAPGEALLIVRAEGFVPYCQRVADDLGAPGGKPLDVELHRGGTLELSLGPAPDAEVLVWLVPRSGQRLSGMPPRDAYPWHELNPLRMRPDETRVLYDLPLTRLEAFAFHPTAAGREFAWLTKDLFASDELPRLHVVLEPLPQAVVRVVRGGVPVPGANVVMKHANPLAATLAAFGDKGQALLNRQPLALVPSAEHATLTGADGRARFGLDPRVRGAPYLTALSPGGLLGITRVYQPRESADGTRECVVDLAEPETTPGR